MEKCDIPGTTNLHNGLHFILLYMFLYFYFLYISSTRNWACSAFDPIFVIKMTELV